MADGEAWLTGAECVIGHGAAILFLCMLVIIVLELLKTSIIVPVSIPFVLIATSVSIE